MLREIRIQNLGVIDDAVLELSAGLNVVTGSSNRRENLFPVSRELRTHQALTHRPPPGSAR